jgi:chemotaxis protein MotA
MEFATLLGLVISLGLVGFAIAMGGNFGAFVDVPSVLIVVVGTIFTTMISFSLAELARTGGIILQTFLHNQPGLKPEALRLIKLAQKARQDGMLSIQKDAAAESEPFLRTALILAVDGASPTVIETILRTETATMIERHEAGINILRRAAEIAPAMGLIGTLIGLVQMLGNLSDPDKIGPSMAIAILTTFYGAVMAYMVFTPLAGKLEHTGATALHLRKLYTAAALSLANKENPRQLELALNAILPPAQRVSVFNK